MRYALIVALVVAAGCSSSPTAPSPVPVTPPVVVVPPVVTPPVVTPPADDGLTRDSRFSLSFYRQLALDGYERPNALQPLRRQAGAPNVYLSTVDDAGTPIDARTLETVSAAVVSVTGALTGKFGIASLQMGSTGVVGEPPPNFIAILWDSRPNQFCGFTSVGGRVIRLYPKTPGCRCAGNPSSIDALIVKHEMGHALGFWHTDSPSDLMYAQSSGACDMAPSAREVFHAQVAYARPVGSLDP